MNKLFISGLLVFFVLLMSCGDDNTGPKIEKEFDRSDRIIYTKVVTHEDYNGVAEAWIEFKKRKGEDPGSVPPGHVRTGWAGWSISKPYQCEIHVVEPKTVEDKQLETWGHELAHCIYGSYHEEVTNG